MEIVRYTPNCVVISARTERPRFLFLSDTYYPGWKVLVNGGESELLRANVAFRAVALPAGEHHIEFVYRPRSFVLGAALSLLSLFGLASAGLWRLMRRGLRRLYTIMQK